MCVLSGGKPVIKKSLFLDSLKSLHKVKVSKATTKFAMKSIIRSTNFPSTRPILIYKDIDVFDSQIIAEKHSLINAGKYLNHTEQSRKNMSCTKANDATGRRIRFADDESRFSDGCSDSDQDSGSLGKACLNMLVSMFPPCSIFTVEDELTDSQCGEIFDKSLMLSMLSMD